MNIAPICHQFEAQATAIDQLAASAPDGAATFRSGGNDWSIVEVVNHLYDEEREDFRRRLDLTLHQPDADWPPIDPAGWVKSRDYASRELGESIHRFLAERERSIAWLRELSSPNWDASHEHPQLGTLRAGDLLASWLGHDLLHLRQITKILWLYQRQETLPYNADYAGPW